MAHFVHYNPPGASTSNVGISPSAISHHPSPAPTPGSSRQQQQQLPPQQQAGPSSSPRRQGPIVAQGDWTKDLVKLAKTAELKKHALTLQMHTAHILSAYATLDKNGKVIQDVKEQKSKLENERTRLLDCLAQVNKDRDSIDMHHSRLVQEESDMRRKIQQLTEGEYALAKIDVDRLRRELGEPPLPSLQTLLDQKSSQYLTERRKNGIQSQNPTSGAKRPAPPPQSGEGQPAKRPRGRPKGSKTRKPESRPAEDESLS